MTASRRVAYTRRDTQSLERRDVSGLVISARNEQLIESEDPDALRADTHSYVAAVLDFLEPLPLHAEREAAEP
jgi:hypothetical protein